MFVTLGELEIHMDSGEPTSSLNIINADLFSICRYWNIAFASLFLLSHVLKRKESKWVESKMVGSVRWKVWLDVWKFVLENKKEEGPGSKDEKSMIRWNTAK